MGYSDVRHAAMASVTAAFTSTQRRTRVVVAAGASAVALLAAATLPAWGDSSAVGGPHAAPAPVVVTAPTVTDLGDALVTPIAPPVVQADPGHRHFSSTVSGRKMG